MRPVKDQRSQLGLIEFGGEVGILEVAEGEFDVVGGAAVGAHFGEVVNVEPLDGVGLVGGLGFAADDGAGEGDFVDVFELERVALFLFVPEGEHFGGFDFVAAFFTDFADDVFRRGEIHVGPAARESPFADAGFTDEQNFSIADDDAAGVEFGGEVADFGGPLEIGELGVEEFGGDFVEAAVAFFVEFAVAVMEAAFGDAFDFAAEGEDIVFHEGNGGDFRAGGNRGARCR